MSAAFQYTEKPPEVVLQLSVMSARAWSPMFGYCWGRLLYHLGTKGIKGYNLKEVIFDVITGQSIVSLGRQQAIEKALKNGATHIFMVDDDMQFPPDILDVYFSRKVPVIAANCLRKNQEKMEGTAIALDGKPHIPSMLGDAEQVERVGAAIMLANVNALRHIPAPLFYNPWVENLGIELGEDYYWCNKLKEYGVPVHVDNLISRASAHQGEFAFHWGNNYPLHDHYWCDTKNIWKEKDKVNSKLILDKVRNAVVSSSDTSEESKQHPSDYSV